MDEFSPLVIEGLTLELLAESSRRDSFKPQKRPARWVHEVRDLLRARFAERLSLEAIAASVGVHPAHLARGFRDCHGCTPGEYVRGLRIEFACHRLTYSDAPISQIALAAGFSDQSHFSNAFKRQMSRSPATFRKMFATRIAEATECSDRARQ
jgi:AraC family transcriptional regulator